MAKGIFRRKEKRSKSLSDPHYWPDFFAKMFGFTSSSGEVVGYDNAFQLSAVYACVRVISETIASLPLMVYRRLPDNGGKEAVFDASLYPILHDSPNLVQTAFEHREMYVGHLCLRGNAFDRIIRDPKTKEIIGLIPLSPARMKVLNDNGNLVYEYTPPANQKDQVVKYKASDIWHKRGLSSDGLMGLSPIEQARDVFGLARAGDRYGSKFFANDARPSGILSTPGRLNEDAKTRLKDSWQQAHGDMESKFMVAVLEAGLKWEQISLSNEDSQFLELRNFQVEEIARIFRVPSILIGHPDKASTYASAEQLMLSFVVHTLRPWLVRLEQSMNKNLLTQEQRDKGYFCEHKVDGLLRGDIKSRYDAYAVAIQNKWMNPNEVRALENMNPREGGEAYENPNITPGKGDTNNDNGDD